MYLALVPDPRMTLALALVALTTACGPQASSQSAQDAGGIRPIAGGTFEASGLAAVPGSNLALFVDDGRPREIFVIGLSPQGLQLGATTRVRLDANVTDPEGMTGDGTHFYMVGSQSKRTGFDGDGLVRFRFDPATGAVTGVERIRGLKAWLAANVPELRGTANRVGDHVLNIEGLAWDPDGGRLLLGFRAPVVGGRALIVPVRLADAAAGFAAVNLRADSTIHLDLGGAGIRAIEHDAEANAFLVVTGASLDTENRDFHVLEWDGRSDSTRVLSTWPRRLKPEGIARMMVEGRSLQVIVFDTGYLLAQ